MEEYLVKPAAGVLRYHDLPGTERPILLIHGLGCAGSFDYPQVAAQKELSGHRRILVDLLGAGYSDKPEHFGYSVSAHADYLADFVTAIGLDDFILFGHSLGGAIAIELADRCQDRVAGLILSEANLDPSGAGSSSNYITHWTLDDFLNGGYDWLIEESRANGNASWAASLSLWSPGAVYRLSQSAVEGGSPSWRERLYRLDCPKTCIFGARSLPDPDSRLLADHHIQIEVVNDAGHSMAWENPSGLAQAIEKGIRGIRYL